MKKILFLLSFFFAYSANALLAEMALPTDSSPYFNSAKIDCFEYEASIYRVNSEIFQADIYPGEYVLFGDENELLLNKFYKSKGDRYIDYRVIELQGLETEGYIALPAIKDANSDTKYSLNTLGNLPRTITIDAKEYLKKGNFSFVLDISNSNYYRPIYSISNDDISYAEVARVEDYDFRYLKINFEYIVDGGVRPLAIKELQIKQKGKSSYLVKTKFNEKNPGPVRVYTGYRCDESEIEKIYSDIEKDSRLSSFGVDAETPVYDLDFFISPYYNIDIDYDGIENTSDNCPYTFNSNQLDSDLDGKGDICDLNNETKNYNEEDSDKDGIGDSEDNCPYVYNPKQKDLNSDSRGDLCSDDDNDGHVGAEDNCVYVSNRGQEDVNANGVGDACEFDKDGDGAFDSIDNCINTINPGQEDQDKDDIGDICDNCDLYNPRQIDANNNLLGDVCEQRELFIEKNDKDKDGILKHLDNCDEMANADQADSDEDGVGDICDNCSGIKNSDQADSNKNGVGDMCDDGDADGVVGYLDNCIKISNPSQKDSDNDGIGDECEDDDGDGVLAAFDNCKHEYNPDQSDIDKDLLGDLCDDRDDRVVESNKAIFKVFIGVVTVVFAGLIFFMFKKMKGIEDAEESNIDKHTK
ncbi:hypothetical protein C0584_00495 [Candidatus Parcubacteria bacterium]|nr:MAG: hypothetical protein C0584_00495 [Candidatus Parcubacteria bacterium]